MYSKKPYTWEEIKTVLLLELKETKHIMTFGTIGSCNVENDVDLIITKKPFSKASDFYKEIHDIYDTINFYLNKRYNCKLIRFTRSDEQFSIENTSNNENDLFFHTMIYLSWSQLERDWKFNMFPDETPENLLINNYNCIKGKLGDLFEENFHKESYYDSIYLYLSFYDKIHSNFPENLFLKAMNHYFDYILRKRLKLKPLIARNKREVRKIFYKIMDILERFDQKNKYKRDKEAKKDIEINVNIGNKKSLSITI